MKINKSFVRKIYNLMNTNIKEFSHQYKMINKKIDGVTG